MKADGTRLMTQMNKVNARLKKLLAEAELGETILKDNAGRNF